MRLFRWTLIAGILIVLGVAIQQSLLWLGVWGNPSESQVKPLADGDQEIALIEPATSTEDWGRLITAVQLLEHEWHKINPTLPKLTISTADAFPPLTAEVPEIVFSFADAAPKLRLRWYKISGEHPAASWVQKLRERKQPPLAIIGGGTSDRAITLAEALNDAYLADAAASPVFAITTATAEETHAKKRLINIYQGRSFRFAFTNQTMVDSLLTFIERREFAHGNEWARNLWVHKTAGADALAGAVLGMSSALQLRPSTMHAFSWLDERYSQDMADDFQKEFRKRYVFGDFDPASIRSGVGGFFHPAPEEQLTVATFLSRPTRPYSFLVLPTSTVRMRRVLINLRQRSPSDARNLVIVNGDAIAFHAIYRDRDVMWNILDLPYSLVFFSHRNPVDPAAGFREENQRANHNGFPPPSTSGTHDILLYRDIFESLLYAVHDGKQLLRDPVAVRDRLRKTCWQADPPRVCNPELHKPNGEHRLLFNADGDRQKHTGEHIVWLKPNFTDEIVDLKSKISVWAIRSNGAGGVWRLVTDFDAYYNQARLEGGAP